MGQFDTIKMFVTSYCNLNCTHCYQSAEKNQYRLTFEKMKEVADFASTHKTRVLDLSGGEFFVHPQAYEFLNYCYEKNIKVNIATNAVAIDCLFFEKYKGTNLLQIQISVDGMEATHDARRGEGTFVKTMNNAEQLSAYDIPLTASMALDAQNYQDALSLLENSCFSNFIFTPVAYAGEAKKNEINEDITDYEETICYIMKQASNKDPNQFQSTIFPNVMAVKYDGGVYISPTAADYDMFCMGNINNKPLDTIVSDYMKEAEYLVLQEVNTLKIEECNHCSECKICDRGDRLRALKFFGDMMKPDPFYCRIMKNTFSTISISRLFWGENSESNT